MMSLAADHVGAQKANQNADQKGTPNATVNATASVTQTVTSTVTPTAAPNITLGEKEFWADLDQTNIWLQDAISVSASQFRSATIEHIHAMWRSVGSVKLSDGTVIAVDVFWLLNPSTDLSALQKELDNVNALIQYHRDHAAQFGDPHGALDALKQVLQDPRFHYPTPTPTPVPDTNRQSLPDISPELGQLILILGGTISVVFLLWTFARGLRVQRVQLPAPPGDEPKTAQAARELAVDSEAVRDYRSAIRYLYLASLLMLDEHGLIHYDRTLTNREHLRQVIGDAELADALRPVVETFDDVWYGFAPVNESMYQQFRANVERLRNMRQVNTPTP